MSNEGGASTLRSQSMSSFIETVKLLVTLGSGVLALSGTFAGKLAGDAPSWALVLLFLSWGALIVSILFGILTLYSIADSQHSDRKNWWALANPRIKWCYWTFLGGITMLVVFAALGSATRAMRTPAVDEPREIELKGPLEIVCVEPKDDPQATTGFTAPVPGAPRGGKAAPGDENPKRSTQN